MAQLVEHILGKDEVPGPNPGSSSRHPRDFISGLWLLIGKNESIGLVFFYYYVQRSGCLELLLCATSGFVRQNCTLKRTHSCYIIAQHRDYRHGGQNRGVTLAAFCHATLQNSLRRTSAASIRVSFFVTSMGGKRMLQTPPRFYLGALVFNRENPSPKTRIFFLPWSSLTAYGGATFIQGNLKKSTHWVLFCFFYYFVFPPAESPVGVPRLTTTPLPCGWRRPLRIFRGRPCPYPQG